MGYFWGGDLFLRQGPISEAGTYFWGGDLFLRYGPTSEAWTIFEVGTYFWGGDQLLRYGPTSVVRTYFWGTDLFQRYRSTSELRTNFWATDLLLCYGPTSEAWTYFWHAASILRRGSISEGRPISNYYFLFLMCSPISGAPSILVRAGCVGVGCLLRNTILTSKKLETRISSINDADYSLNFPGGLSEDAVISTGHNGLSTQWWSNDVLILTLEMSSH